MKIYNIDGTEYLDIAVSDESYRYRELRGESYVQLEFALATHVELPLRSYIIIDDERYTLLEAAKIESEHSRSYAYTARYEAPQQNFFKSKMELLKYWCKIRTVLQLT